MKRSSLLVGLGLALMAASCGGRSANAPDPVSSATQRIQGNWRVESFTPDAPLEPPLQGLLNAQLGSLTVSFQGASFSATGPGVTMTGHYKIWSAALDQFSGTIYDSTGVGYRIAGQFDATGVQFKSFDAPWKGQGRLAR